MEKDQNKSELDAGAAWGVGGGVGWVLGWGGVEVDVGVGGFAGFAGSAGSESGVCMPKSLPQSKPGLGCVWHHGGVT
jgi:hypothetical protein